jgi:hypothetical protein
VERVTGIEPALSAWEADVLPLNYTRGCRKPYTKAPDSGGCRGLGKTGITNGEDERPRTREQELAFARAGVTATKTGLDRAIRRGDTGKADVLREALRKAEARLAAAEANLGEPMPPEPIRQKPKKRKIPKRVRPVLTREQRKRPAVADALFERPAPSVVATLDPDHAKKTVWIFKTGSTYHRRDCEVVESRDGAVEVPVDQAKHKGLTHCMRCSPSVW